MKLRLTLLITALVTILSSHAQLATGSWRQYAVHGEFSGLIDSPSDVWYATGGCLYRYDKKADETVFYEGGRELSGNTVKFIRLNRDLNLLAVVYTDGNIDMLSSDGSRTNLPDIRDAVINVDKTINDIVFDGSDMYVATGFGLVIYDLNRMEVRESGVYNRAISTVILTPRHIFITPTEHTDWVYDLLCIERGRPINNYNNFTKTYTYYNLISQAEPLDDSHTRFATVRFNRVGSLEINDEDGSVTSMTDRINTDLAISHLSRADDGTVRFITDNGTIGHYVNLTTAAIDITLPEQFAGNMLSSCTDLSSVWLADLSGLGQYSFSSDGGVTVLRDKSIPSDAITFNSVCNIYPSSDPSRFYIANLGMTQRHPVGNGDYFDVRLRLNRVSRDGIDNIDPSDVTAYTSPVLQSQRNYGKYIFSPTMIAEDPDRPDRLYIGSGGEGVYVIENGVQIAKFDGSNAPINKIADYYWGTVCVSIDPDGNLWVGSRGEVAGTLPNTLAMLPAAKRALEDPSKLTAADWVAVDYERCPDFKDIKILHCTQSQMMFAIDGADDWGFLAVNTRGTRGDLSDDIAVTCNNVPDQDGNILKDIAYTCLLEDRRGQVWLGTTTGVMCITNPTKATTSDFSINRIKVPRNDGSGLADYLLETDQIVDMAIDSSNRKWIATKSSGLFLVSEDGDKIISNFTTSNSPLPSNTITSVYADPESNSIFVGTLTGLYEYSSTSGPAAADYSDVYAYPNPVTPDYSGWITITGLMDSSLVKIMDSSMNLVYQTTSEGGTAIWDACTASGSRVRSGVYYVLASSGSDTTSAGDVVAKILVVN